ncbi:hypothetical protein ACFL6S_21980 [Candidatus Poribacteria bacterium]
MNMKIQPVAFGGVDWLSRAKLDMELQPTAREIAMRRLPELSEHLRDIELLDLCEVNSREDIGKLIELSREADMVIVLAAELLSVRYAAKALSAVRVPVVLACVENRPGAVFSDMYGYLKADRHDVYLTLDAIELQAIIHVIRARKRLVNTKALLIGDGYPSHSQVANPDSPRVVEEKLGVVITQRSIAELRRQWESAEENKAKAQAQIWLDGAEAVADSARRDIVQSAKMYLAMKSMIGEVGANALTIDCRTWDLLSCEEFHSFYSPCMGLTTLRWEGILASCEADICAMLSMCMLNYVSDLPPFLGNIGKVDRDRGSVGIGGHAACTVNMDGKGGRLAGYRLTDYGGRGGVASYCSTEGDDDVTIARLDRNLDYISVAAGKTVPTQQCFEVAVGNVEDFIHRCLTGDHYIVVYGDHLKEMAMLGKLLGIGILTPDPA